MPPAPPAGVAALAVSVVQGPFSWLNAACWLVYVASVVLSAAVLVWGVAVWPVRELRAVDKVGGWVAVWVQEGAGGVGSSLRVSAHIPFIVSSAPNVSVGDAGAQGKGWAALLPAP